MSAMKDLDKPPSFLLGQLCQGQRTMETAMQEITKTMREHGEQLAKGEQNFKILNNAIDGLSSDIKDIDGKIEKVSSSISKLTQEFRDCKTTRDITGSCNIDLVNKTKKEDPGIVINVPKIDFSDVKIWMAIIGIILTVCGIKYGPLLIHAIGG